MDFYFHLWNLASQKELQHHTHAGEIGISQRIVGREHKFSGGKVSIWVRIS